MVKGNYQAFSCYRHQVCSHRSFFLLTWGLQQLETNVSNLSLNSKFKGNKRWWRIFYLVRNCPPPLSRFKA